MSKKAKITFSKYDAADYLKTEEDMAAYLTACIEDSGDDPELIAVAIGNIARAYGMMKISQKTGLTREGLYRSLSKDGNPSFGTVLKVMRALGLKLTAQAA